MAKRLFNIVKRHSYTKNGEEASSTKPVGVLIETQREDGSTRRSIQLNMFEGWFEVYPAEPRKQETPDW